MTLAEHKKLLSKLKKAEAKGGGGAGGAGGGGGSGGKKAKGKKGKKGKGGGGAAAAVAAVVEAANGAADDAKEDAKGEYLARTKTPLEEADRFLRPLVELAPKRLITHVLAFEVAWRKKRVLLMLQALRRAMAIDAQAPATRRLVIVFLHFFEQARDGLNPTVQSVASLELKSVLGEGATAASSLKALVADASGSLPHLLVAAEMRLLLGESAAVAADTLLSVKSLDGLRGADLDMCHRTLHFLRTKLGEDRSSSFREKCAERFPLAKWESNRVYVGPLVCDQSRS